MPPKKSPPSKKRTGGGCGAKLSNDGGLYPGSSIIGGPVMSTSAPLGARGLDLQFPATISQLASVNVFEGGKKKKKKPAAKTKK